MRGTEKERKKGREGGEREGREQSKQCLREINLVTVFKMENIVGR